MSFFSSNQRKNDNKSDERHLIIRGLADLYLAYLTSCVIKNYVTGESSMQEWLQISLIIIFALVTVAVGLWTLRDYLSKRRLGVLSEEENVTGEESETGDVENA